MHHTLSVESIILYLNQSVNSYLLFSYFFSVFRFNSIPSAVFLALFSNLYQKSGFTYKRSVLPLFISAKHFPFIFCIDIDASDLNSTSNRSSQTVIFSISRRTSSSSYPVTSVDYCSRNSRISLIRYSTPSHSTHSTSAFCFNSRSLSISSDNVAFSCRITASTFSWRVTIMFSLLPSVRLIASVPPPPANPAHE